MKLSEKEREKRIDLLCGSYSLIKDLVTIFGVPAEHREDLIQDILLLAYRHIDDLKETEKMNCGFTRSLIEGRFSFPRKESSFWSRKYTVMRI